MNKPTVDILKRMFGDGIVEKALTRKERIYHYVTCPVNECRKYAKGLEKYGLCSPKALFDLDRDLFMETSYEVYKERAATYLGKSVGKVSGEDIIDYLDNGKGRKENGFNSSTLFFSFIPFTLLNNQVKKRIAPVLQVSVDIEKVQKYQPLLVIHGKVKKISWEEIKDEEFTDWVESVSDKEPTNKKRVFGHIPHLAVVGVYRILFKDFATMLDLY